MKYWGRETDMMVTERNSSLIGKITMLVMGIFVVNTALALDGSGTQEDPWRIKSLDDFNDFAADANYWDDYTRLETDVNLAGRIYSIAVIAPDVNNSNRYFDGIAFTGTFDGSGFVISNLTINTAAADNDFLGLFGKIMGAEIKNLGIETVNIVGINSTSDRNGNAEAALAAENNGGSISNCYSTGSVAGGINSIALGGLVGYNDGIIKNCYSTCSVSGGVNSTALGGLVGINQNLIDKCYSIGPVSGESGSSDVCGFIGDNTYGTVSNSFWNKETSGRISGGGGSGRTTAQMERRSTFTGWDFINVWNIGENQTYPYLRTYLPSDINKDGIVNFLDLATTANQWMEGVE
jgi:hypothetical protein